MCNITITFGVDVETSEGVEHFALTTEDQIDIQNLSLQVAAGAPFVLYHADDKLCRKFTATEINALMTVAISHVTYHTTLFNHLKAWVTRETDPDVIAGITYASALPDDLAANMATLLGGTDDA